MDVVTSTVTDLSLKALTRHGNWPESHAQDQTFPTRQQPRISAVLWVGALMPKSTPGWPRYHICGRHSHTWPTGGGSRAVVQVRCQVEHLASCDRMKGSLTVFGGETSVGLLEAFGP